MKLSRRPVAATTFAIAILVATSGCTAPPPRAHGQHLQLETVTHDWQTTYVYRPVDTPKAPPKPSSP